jgi:hypothetical protein
MGARFPPGQPVGLLTGRIMTSQTDGAILIGLHQEFLDYIILGRIMGGVAGGALNPVVYQLDRGVVCCARVEKQSRPELAVVHKLEPHRMA